MYNLDLNVISKDIEPKLKVSKRGTSDDGIQHKTRRLLYVGVNGKVICQHMVDLNYIGLSLQESEKAFKWLLRKLETGSDLPDAIICDSVLPDGNIFDFFEKINKSSKLKSIPFIVLSHKNCEKEKAKAIEVGVDDYYSSNFNAEDLHYRINFLSEFKNKGSEAVDLEDDFDLNHIIPKNSKMPFTKRAFDILFSSMALFFASPVLILVAVLVRLESKGSIFYISKRAGSGYKIFDFYKFRSMKVGADAELANLKHLNQYTDGDGGNSTFVKINNDPRVTKVGAFLRKTSLDELPQLFNVLKGDMSIVGNRPLPLYEAEQLTKDDWAKRFLAPAGITGLWQVTKRGQKDMSHEERMQLDIDYANNYSFLMDLKIMLKTFPALLQSEDV